MRTYSGKTGTIAIAIAVAALTAGTARSQPAAKPAAPARDQPAPSWNAWSPLDNPRVHVWSDASRTPAAAGTLPQVRIWLDGHIQYLAPGAKPEAHATSSPRESAGTIVVELKDTHIAPRPNPTAYPLAFPRPRVKKLLENDRVIVWDYSWTAGEPTPMHYHDKDVVVTYLADGALRSTDPKGQSVVNPHYFGFTKFNAGDRTHTEELIRGAGRAIIVELKR